MTPHEQQRDAKAPAGGRGAASQGLAWGAHARGDRGTVAPLRLRAVSDMLPRGGAQILRGAPRASAGSPASAWASTIERDAVTSARRRDAARRPAPSSSTRRPARHAGQQEDRARHQLAQAPEELRLGCAHDRAHVERPHSPAALRRARRRARRAARAAAARPRPELRRARVGGAHQHEQPAPPPPAASTSGSSASRPSSGLAVKASAPSPATGPKGLGGRAHERLGVGAAVTGTSPRLPSASTSRPWSRAIAATSERLPARRPEPLEAGELRLTATHAGPAATIAARQCWPRPRPAHRRAGQAAPVGVPPGARGPRGGDRTGIGSRPSTTRLRRSGTSAASRSQNGGSRPRRSR